MHFIYIQRIICVKPTLSTLSSLQNRHFHPEKAVLAPFVKYFELFPKKKAILDQTGSGDPGLGRCTRPGVLLWTF